MVSRRQFVRGILAAVAAGAVLDVDKLLWVPGAKRIFIPEPFAFPDFIAPIDWEFASEWLIAIDRESMKVGGVPEPAWLERLPRGAYGAFVTHGTLTVIRGAQSS